MMETETIVPLGDQVAAVEREIRMRERVYPRWIDSGKMTPTKARSEIEAMKAVLRTLRRLEKAERLL